jgi:hypothetical protein
MVLSFGGKFLRAKSVYVSAAWNVYRLLVCIKIQFSGVAALLVGAVNPLNKKKSQELFLSDHKTSFRH